VGYARGLRALAAGSRVDTFSRLLLLPIKISLSFSHDLIMKMQAIITASLIPIYAWPLEIAVHEVTLTPNSTLPRAVFEDQEYRSWSLTPLHENQPFHYAYHHSDPRIFTALGYTVWVGSPRPDANIYDFKSHVDLELYHHPCGRAYDISRRIYTDDSANDVCDDINGQWRLIKMKNAGLFLSSADGEFQPFKLALIRLIRNKMETDDSCRYNRQYCQSVVNKIRSFNFDQKHIGVTYYKRNGVGTFILVTPLNNRFQRDVLKIDISHQWMMQLGNIARPAKSLSRSVAKVQNQPRSPLSRSSP
jgi:hypothetical protein